MLLVCPVGAEFDETARLLHTERDEFAAVFGGPVRVVRADPGHGARWVFRVDGGHRGAAVLRTDGELLESVAGTAAELWQTPNWLHTWLRLGRPAELSLTACPDTDAAVRRIEAEVGASYPAFQLRGLDWAALCAEHAPLVRAAADPVAAMQRWMAVLADAHTGLRPPGGAVPLPYVGYAGADAVTLLRVPESSAAHAAGVRPGWQVTAPAQPDLLARTAAPAHMRPYRAARQLLSGPPGIPLTVTARGPDGTEATFTETPAWVGPDGVASWRVPQRGTGYLRVHTWLGGHGLPGLIDTAFAELAGCRTLILDLRGNVGGNYLLALATRDRFVRPGTALGTTRYSTGTGSLTAGVPIVAGDTDLPRWPGGLVVLTDPLTYSASEDFLLGLQGLPHVRVVGEPSGGGSGRPRTVPLLAGWNLTVSTVLTYDRTGHCVENAGIPVDHPVPADAALDAALALNR